MIEILKKAQGFKVMSVFPSQLTEGNPKLCVITGGNASGKSLIRRVFHAVHQDEKIEYIHISQQGRCGHSLGALKSMVYGCEEDESTGYNTAGTIIGAMRTGKARTNPFGLMLDEPEIGCSEELAAGIALRLDQDFDELTYLDGMYIITHNRQLVKHLLHRNPTHLRMSDDGMDLNQWVNRNVVPVQSLEEMRDLGLERWRAVNKIMSEKRK